MSGVDGALPHAVAVAVAALAARQVHVQCAAVGRRSPLIARGVVGVANLTEGAAVPDQIGIVQRRRCLQEVIFP